MNDFRIEHDSMGEVRVPAGAKWGAQTQRAVDNFPISGLRVERALIAALASIKGAAAMENARLKILDRRAGRALLHPLHAGAAGNDGDPVSAPVFHTGAPSPAHTKTNN